MPECATCEEYVSPDFVRVFGDNNRVVTACLSCRGAKPEPDQSAGPAETAEYNASETEQADDTEYEPEPYSHEADPAEPASASQRVDVTEPETAATATGGGSSPMSFLRSVFLR
ncbi:DUF7563 family protein [Halogranum gelatinilyticum]|nr:hypothetical protein [Halogranum gelatinilyticum]